MKNGNCEPGHDLLRWSDVVAWQPRVTFYLMRKWVKARKVHPVRVTRQGWPYYRKSELVKVFRSNLQ